MEEKIKDIIAVYLKTTPASIDGNTLINRQALSSSIILHRMYGELANNGFVVDNYTDISTYAELLMQLSGSKMDTTTISSNIEKSDSVSVVTEMGFDALSGVGIDIEKIDEFPVCHDYREDEFYKNNFTAEEIAYCILKKDPLASFAGLFSAKEAIVKADNKYSGKPFNTIPINHDRSGKPYHPDFFISISHSDENVVSIALSKRNQTNAAEINASGNVPNTPINISLVLKLSLISLLISLFSIIIAFFCLKLAH